MQPKFGKWHLKLEGITRNTGKHAGGVVIAPTKLTDYSAVLCDADGTNRVAQFDKDDVEAAGLVKFDFLGLRNLTVIEDAIKHINARPDITTPVDISLIPLDDKPAYAVFADANTTAVFQFESVGMEKNAERGTSKQIRRNYCLRIFIPSRPDGPDSRLYLTVCTVVSLSIYIPCWKASLRTDLRHYGVSGTGNAGCAVLCRL